MGNIPFHSMGESVDKSIDNKIENTQKHRQFVYTEYTLCAFCITIAYT